jgi:GntR family transcriptional regulator
MLIQLDPRDPRPVYVQIVDEVRRVFVSGDFDSGEPLPSVRDLAGRLRINPNTVGQAYRELERQGVVAVRRGQGTYFTEPTATAAQRRAVARDVAARAIQDAHRSGIDSDELIQAIRAASHQRLKQLR